MTTLPTIVSLVPKIAAGRVSPVDVLDECLARIDRLEGELHAWVFVDREGAHMAARRLAGEARRGTLRGPLHGIPVGIKDIVDVAAMPTLAGSPLRSGHVAGRDAPLVVRLRDAGAVILGKTVTTEFASFDPSPTRNPWNPRHTPGGSSSGSAAAVAVGMCLAAVGSQTGGSITRPAGYCGVCGCKPTFGLVDTGGVFPLSPRLDHPGPIARCTADLRIMLAAMTGRPLPTADMPEHLRLGLVESYYLDEAGDEVVRAVREAAASLAAAGAVIEPVTLPESFRRVHEMHYRIMAVEAAATHRDMFPARRADYGSNIATLLDRGTATTDAEYREAVVAQQQFRGEIAAVLDGLDALVTPATPTPAPAGLESTGDPKFNSPWSHAGVPTVSFPVGLSHDGLPIALQCVGRAGEDAALLSVCQWCEARLPFAHLPAG